MNTGNRFGGDPAVGAWVTYGLGSENQDLPGFIVLPELAYPQGGAANWGNGFLPAHYQGTALRAGGSPILDLKPPAGIDTEHQRANLDLLERLNRRHAEEHAWHQELTARLNNYELAFRMQMQVPQILDIESEDETTREMYGVGKATTDKFGRKCLLARRLVERGVRFVQLYAGTWDSHDYIERAHGTLIRAVDQPIAALIQDLKRRGMLDQTLVVWCGEFGRSPDNGVRGGTAYGRDHNAQAMTIWLAGGGVNAGHTIGMTDELGASAVDVVHPIRDLHVTLLRLLGLDDNKLTYFSGGRFKQLSQFGGQVIGDLIA
jgi:membrane-anchored protein YejM (alkaline phosphatase superfamily)